MNKILLVDDDELVVPEFGRQLAERIPQSQLEIGAVAGYYPQIECLEELMVKLTASPCAKIGESGDGCLALQRDGLSPGLGRIG
jgi:hypothetical protein